MSVLLSRSKIGLSLAFVAGGSIIVLNALVTSDATAAKKRRRPAEHLADASAAAEAASRSASESSASPDGGVSQRARTVDGGLGCYYGSQIDGHTGREACLSPEQRDPPLHVLADTRHLAEQLGMLRPDAGSDARSDGAEAGLESDDEADGGDDGVSGQYKARVVSVAFENGAVGRAHQSLKRLKHEMADCVAAEGGLKAPSARLKLMFLVRPRGRAEGIIVSGARNIPPKVVRCITKLVESHAIGTPSNDPVGVTALIELKERE